MTATITKEAAAWKLPDLDTVYHCEELGPMTLGQMLNGCVCSMELWPVEHRVSVQLSGGF